MFILAHGIGSVGVYDGTIGQLAGKLEEANQTVIPFIWEPAHFWNVKARARRSAGELAALVDSLRRNKPGEEVHFVGHSAAALLLRETMKFEGVYFDDVFLISPAISRKPKFTDNAYHRAFVFHNAWDIAVLAGALLPFHSFGSLGRKGFHSTDGRRVNLPVPSTTGRWNHSKNWFHGEQASWLVEQIVRWSHTHYHGPEEGHA